MAFQFPTFGDTSGGVFETTGGDPFATFPPPPASPNITGVQTPADTSGLAGILQRGIGSIADAGLQKFARNIAGGDTRTETVVLKQREARRKRRASQKTFGVDTKSIFVAVAVVVLSLVGLSLFFRR